MGLRSKRGALRGTIRHARHKSFDVLEFNKSKPKRQFQPIDMSKPDWSIRKK